MIAIGVRYLTGYAVAHDLTQQKAEWPPHPARLFMAMAAAHYETGGDAWERQALLWLEEQPPPGLRASDADERTIYETYVPVNDDPKGIQHRSRQPRSFPTVRPHIDEVFFVWQTEPPETTMQALGRLCQKVTRVGHSSSLVQVWVQREDPNVNLVPDNTAGDYQLRVAESGLLSSLVKAFNEDELRKYWTLRDGEGTATGAELRKLKQALREFPKDGPRHNRPNASTWQRYRQLSHEPPESQTQPGPFDSNFIVLTKVEGPNLGLESTLALTGALRNAMLKASGDTPPEWISGHQPDGKPSRQPHVALFPLPHIGAEYADGHVLGLGIAVPRLVSEGQLAADQLRRYLGPLLFDSGGQAREVRLWKAGAWQWKMEREARVTPPVALRQSTWTGAAKEWASVTPVVLHHHPDKGKPEDVERILRDAFRSALLPEPSEIEIKSVSFFRGAGHARSMPVYTEGDPKQSRYHVHLRARFLRPVNGPVLVGRGRFRGYGLLRPWEDRRRD